MNKKEIKVLFISANPTDNNIRIDQEVHDIESRIKRGKYRDQLQFIPKFAVQPNDIQSALLDVNPDIVHISGHGDRLGSLIVENPKRGEGKDRYIKIKPAPLGRLFGLFAHHLRCVLISACYSGEALDSIHQHIPFVIGMQDSVHYEAAQSFEIGFYDALVDGRPIPFAFNLGCNSMDLNGFDGQIPVIRMEPGSLGDLFGEIISSKKESGPSAHEELADLEKEGLEEQLAIYIKKLNYLRKESVIAVDASMQFSLKMQIEELEQKIEAIKRRLEK
ncbi:MAG: hypothetical protein H6557_04690 [Lewinellaceae bacterium]|nr:hypothetical protein [Phaeodactylibacter sp.]MCB9035900.1 hypothetical protein [Lewinellaceae bacterium]